MILLLFVAPLFQSIYIYIYVYGEHELDATLHLMLLHAFVRSNKFRERRKKKFCENLVFLMFTSRKTMSTMDHFHYIRNCLCFFFLLSNGTTSYWIITYRLLKTICNIHDKFIYCLDMMSDLLTWSDCIHCITLPHSEN